MQSTNNKFAEVTQSLNILESEYGEMNKKVVSLKDDEDIIKGRIQFLLNEEKGKINLLKQLDNSISEKESGRMGLYKKSSDIENELNEKKNQILKVKEEYEKVLSDINEKRKEYYSVDEDLTLKEQKVSRINLELKELSEKSDELKNQAESLERKRDELISSLSEEREKAEQLKSENEKIQELLSLHEQRKKEIENGNNDLEGKFTKMFQKYNNELNEINRKRSILEQVVNKKEKEIDEKEQTLNEKLTALEETERTLNVKQAEIEAVEQMLLSIDEQKEQIKNELIKIDEESIERKSYNSEIKLETELLLKKKATLEKVMHELLNMMNRSFAASKDKKEKLENDILIYDEELQHRRDKISDAMQEYVELQSSIKSVKVEFEESKSSVAKLLAMRKKLQSEISKHQIVLQRYQKIREKIKSDQMAGKDESNELNSEIDTNKEEIKNSQEADKKNAQIYKL